MSRRRSTSQERVHVPLEAQVTVQVQLGPAQQAMSTAPPVLTYTDWLEIARLMTTKGFPKICMRILFGALIGASYDLIGSKMALSRYATLSAMISEAARLNCSVYVYRIGDVATAMFSGCNLEQEAMINKAGIHAGREYEARGAGSFPGFTVAGGIIAGIASVWREWYKAKNEVLARHEA